MSDRFLTHAKTLDAPADTAFAITPSDSLDLSEITRALYIGTGGNIALTTAAGNELTLANLQTGTILPLRCRRIKATSTTASNIVGLV